MLDTTAFNVTVCLCSLLLLTTFPLNLPCNTDIYTTRTITTSIIPKVATGKANTLEKPESAPDTQRYKKHNALNIFFLKRSQCVSPPVFAASTRWKPLYINRLATSSDRLSQGSVLFSFAEYTIKQTKVKQKNMVILNNQWPGWQSSVSTPLLLLGCTKAIRVPCAPLRGFSSIIRAPSASSFAIAASMFSTSYAR